MIFLTARRVALYILLIKNCYYNWTFINRRRL